MGRLLQVCRCGCALRVRPSGRVYLMWCFLATSGRLRRCAILLLAGLSQDERLYSGIQINILLVATLKCLAIYSRFVHRRIPLLFVGSCTCHIVAVKCDMSSTYKYQLSSPPPGSPAITRHISCKKSDSALSLRALDTTPTFGPSACLRTQSTTTSRI